jgi:MFS family permease
VFAAAPLGALSLMRPLVVGSLTLHGIGYTFFFVASQIFIDRVAPKDIRSSAQSLLTFATLGLGNFLGTLFTTTIMERYTQAGATNWPAVFAVPCVLTVGCAIAFSALVREPQLTP